METIILNEINEFLNLEQNTCFKDISSSENSFCIENKNKSVSTTIITRELCEIQDKLEEFHEYFELKCSFDKILIFLTKNN